MALLELGGRRFTLPQGEVLLGADPGSAIPLAVPGVLPRHAKLKSLPDGQVVITKAVPEAEGLINGEDGGRATHPPPPLPRRGGGGVWGHARPAGYDSPLADKLPV